jgi:hypothetical protein
MYNISKQAYTIAEQHHDGIFRKDNKTPYFEHPKAVAELAEDAFLRKEHWDFFVGEHEFLDIDIWTEDGRLKLLDRIVATCYTHDCLEDKNKHGQTLDYNILAALDVTTALSVSGMTRYANEPYLYFILRAKRNPISRFCKRFDIKHNLSDLKDGSLRDKYIMGDHLLLA